MSKNKILEKLLAIILIFTLTSANFAFVTESLATTMIDTWFGDSEDTGHKNVEFEAYFNAEEEKISSAISDVNNENLSIGFDLNVLDSGYLKDAKVEIKENEEGAGLNFVLKENQELSEMIQNLDNNVIEFRQIDCGSNLNIQLPIEYKNETYINESKLSKDFKVCFTGIYVDDEGEEKELSKEVILNLSWKDERKVKVESLISKYIQFGNEEKGVILQTSVKIDGTSEKNTLPVKETKLDIEVPKINGVAPKNISLVAASTQGTNGKFAEEVKFNEGNWIYDEETNILSIKVENEKELVQVDEFEDEYLKDIDKEIIEEERYYSKSGIDEFLITYTFQDVDLSEEIPVSFNASAEVTTFSGVESDGNIYVVKDNQNFEYSLVGQTGDIVSYNIENETGDVSKAYTYLNYNTDNDYEIEYRFKNIINVSMKELVQEMKIEDVEENYVFKDGTTSQTNDLYYKQIYMDKENVNTILGEDGVVEVLDKDGNTITTINKDYPVSEDGKIIVDFEERIDKLSIKTTKPVNEGNLNINYVKASKDASISKEEYKNLASVTSKVKMTARYEYVEEPVLIGEATSETKLNDTTTKLNLVLDRDNLSTITKNTNVEMRVELNNHLDTSDIFGNSSFEITLPEYVTNVELTDVTMVYGEGLNITNSEVINENGIFKIRVTVDGKQEAINSGVLTNGANIEIYANIDVDLYAPAKEETITLYAENSETTNKENEVEEVKINYSAPTGLVTVNSIANYNNVGNVLTSVRQGKQEDIIEIYSEAKQATMEIIVMNNNKNTVSEVSILGRIPFEGVKDIATGDDLGTTLDTKLIGNLVPDARNNSEFKVYYSENKEATKDLNDSQNGWVENPETLENIKSYLIVPVDENYEMQEAEIIRFTYVYEIPANLEHNEDIYGTFLAYYKNNSEIAVTDETSSPDKVGLTTGEGPELSIETKTNVEKISEFEELKISATVKNTGKEIVENVVVKIPVPKYSKFSAVELNDESIAYTVNENEVEFTISNIEAEQEQIVTANVIVNDFPTVQEYYNGMEGVIELEDGTYVIRTYEETDVIMDDEEVKYKDEVLPSNPTIELEAYSTVTAKDLQKELKSEVKKVEIEAAEYEIHEMTEDIEVVNAVGREVNFNIIVKNLTSETKENVQIMKQLPDEFSFSRAFSLEYEADGLTSHEIDNAKYDEATRTVIWNIEKLEPNKPIQVSVKIIVNQFTDGTNYKDVYSFSKVQSEGTKEYLSNTVQTRIGKSSLEFSQTTDKENTYVREGEIINYIFKIKNNGSVAAKDVKLMDKIPDGLIVRNITYTLNGIESKKRVSKDDEVTLSATITPNDEMTIKIQALAENLNGIQEKTVTNVGSISAVGLENTETNAITHIIEQDPTRNRYTVETPDLSTDGSVPNNSNSSNVVKTYKVSGTAWLDDNKDGKRDDYEATLSNVKANLVNVETGVIVKNTTTDSKGTYTFAGIEEGNYIVMFEYDTVKYTVTTYQKSGVEGNLNSDAIVTQVEQNGRLKNAAVTDTITVQNGSISNVDLGLVLADTFDLKLDKTITKITVQNKVGTNTTEFDKTQLAQAAITGKYLSSSVVYIEYNIAVSNIGDISGYAKKIVDYIPEGMTFKSELNPDWYTGTDGMLYTTALAETELKTGETRELKLVLTKQMTEENTGMVNNRAEIFEDYNIYGVSDKNSTPGNNVQNENDLSNADAILTVKTGEVFIHISVIITSILLGSIVIFISYNKLIVNKKKGGA